MILYKKYGDFIIYMMHNIMKTFIELKEKYKEEKQC